MKQKLLQILVLLIAQFSFSQLVLTVSTSDSCMNPLPNSGTYTQSGTLNGKPMYVKGANLRIIWTGTQWEVQGDDPAIAGVNFITAWFNTKNTATPPADCWQASFGCFPISLSGASAFPVVNSTAAPTIVATSNTATTVTYTVTFSGAINGLTASNFSVTATGITGSIASVTQTANPSVYTVVVNYGTGNGSVRLNLANETGASALIGCATAFPVQGNTFYPNFAPVTLAPGDIAFTGYNSDPTNDEFSFIVLKSGGLPVGTKLFFTDNGFNNLTNQLSTNEGIMFLDVTTAIPQFSQIKITSGTTYTVTPLGTGAATASVVGTAFIALSTGGDQVIAYQGYTTTPTFISAIHLNADNTGTLSSLSTWDDFTNGVSASRSAIPTGLTNGTNAVMVVTGTAGAFTEIDNAVYNCTGANSGNETIIRTSINDRANWTLNDVTPFTIPPVCTFLGTNNPTLENKISIYPNPTNSIINIKITDLSDAKTTIYDVNGRELKTQKITQNLNTIDISSLAKGVYILQITTEEGILTKQIVRD